MIGTTTSMIITLSLGGVPIYIPHFRFIKPYITLHDSRLVFHKPSESGLVDHTHRVVDLFWIVNNTEGKGICRLTTKIDVSQGGGD